MQERQEMAKVIGDITNNAISIATYNEREKINKLSLEKFKAEEKYGKASTQAQEIGKQITAIQNDIDGTYGIGSKTGMAIRAVTAALQAAAQNDTAGSLVALASPYLNKTIHEMTAGDTAKDKAANLMAHALLSTVEFQVTGKDPLTGAVAGVTGEVTAQILTQAIYNKTPNQLTANEKENISTLSQLAGGLAAALTAKANGATTEQGGNFLAATSGAGTAKRAVGNNFLSDASRARLNALKTKYHRGEQLTNKEKLEFRDLIESDQRSDVLLDKFRKDPNSLNSKEREAFLSYVDRYYIETVTGNTASGYKLASPISPVNAKNRFESEYLINDPVPKRDYGHFPFAGTDAQRSQAVNTLPEESKNWLGWRSEKHSRDEEMYYTVKNELDAPENYKNSANGKIAYSVKDGLEAGSMLALGSGTAVVRGVALMEKTAATVGGEAITLANKGGQVLRLGKDAATKAYIDGQLTYINLVDKGIKAYNTASTKAANAYINGQLAYADAIAKGVNTAKIAAREGIEGTRELVSQGIYYSYRPAELVVDTGKAIASMPKPYKTAFGVSAGAGGAGESFYYMDGSKSLSNPVDVLGSVYNVGVNAAYDSAFYTANPLQSLGLDTLKGIGKDNKGVSESFNDSGKSNSFSMLVDSVGKKFGINESTTKFVSSILNNSLDYNQNKKQSIDSEKKVDK